MPEHASHAAPPCPQTVGEDAFFRELAAHTGKGLRLLFIHQNFPSPYEPIAAHYAADPANLVCAVGEARNLRQFEPVPGVKALGYALPPPVMAEEPLARRFQLDVVRGKAAAAALQRLKDRGFTPDVILGDPVWGEMLFLRSIYPDVPVLARAEMYIDAQSPLLRFDPEWPWTGLGPVNITGRAAAMPTWAEAELLYAPTRFQRDMFPPLLRGNIRVMHEGIDCALYAPASPGAPNATGRPDMTGAIVLPPTANAFSPTNAPLPDFVPRRTQPLTLPPRTPIITFVNRTLEPCRGWHVFARALPALQKRHPDAHCIIIGRTEGGYGPPPPGGGNWRDLLLHELRGAVDFARLHFLGNVPSQVVRALLRRSQAHVYLTYPFVPSFSPLESMACAAPLVTCDVAPMRELTPGETALHVDFFDRAALVDALSRLLADADLRRRLGQAGREHVLAQYDFTQVCLPLWDEAIRALAAGHAVPPVV